MAKNLTQIGADMVVMIDQSILDLLKITPEANVRIKIDGKKIVIEALQEEIRDAIGEFEDLQNRSQRKTIC